VTRRDVLAPLRRPFTNCARSPQWNSTIAPKDRIYFSNGDSNGIDRKHSSAARADPRGAQGLLDRECLDELYRQALIDTIQRFEATGSPIITDGEQTKPSFATYPIHGSDNLAPDGVIYACAQSDGEYVPESAPH